MRHLDPHRPARLVSFVGLSLLLHAGVLRLPWLTTYFSADFFAPPAPRLTMIELTPEITTATNQADNTELRRLEDFHSSALERATALEQTLVSALSQQTETEAARQAQVAALAATHTTLSGQVESLTAEKADLAAQLAEERQRRAEMEQQVHAARQSKEMELAGIKGTYDRLVTALKGEISQKEIALHQAKEKLVVTILDRVLFPSGQATLSPGGLRVMEKVAAILAKVHDRRIVVEGHTDNVPIGAALSGRFPTNWELSTARATEVVKFLIAHGKLQPYRLSAAGRADTAPVASNAGEDGRQHNRRIEIILLPPEDHTAGLS
jgi:chemotaxis protein MotB